MKLAAPPESITHLHLFSVIVTELISRNFSDNKLRVLDAGCGNGHFLTFLQRNLESRFPEIEVEIYGYDVADHGVQAKDFFNETVKWCENSCPSVHWPDRLKLICHDDNWPFESNFFDFVISNQVLEHVSNHSHFFLEHARVLKSRGIGVHLFPLRHYIYEGHLLLPYVHMMSDWYFMKSYIGFMSSLGFGKFRKQNKLNLDEYSEKHADYMTFNTNYLSYSELVKIVKESVLRTSFKYTADFYWHKVRQLSGRTMRIDLGRKRSVGLITCVYTHIFKYISSITLLVEKENTYS